MAQEKNDKKNRIINAAIDLYVNDPSAFTLKNIAKKARVKEADIFKDFPNKIAILKGYYAGIVPQYKEMIREIDGFELFDLHEKLSNFVYSSLDMMQEQRDFVEKTFNGFIYNARPKSAFQSHIEELVEDFVQKDTRIAGMNQYLLNAYTYNVLSNFYLQLVIFWIRDESPGSEKTIALTDKLSSFLSEVLYSAIIDKGLDLGKFLVANRNTQPNSPFWQACVEQFKEKGMYK
ncbi:MAG: hypothetical protein WD266_04935 [Balneolales bacterium]